MAYSVRKLDMIGRFLSKMANSCTMSGFFFARILIGMDGL